MAETLRRGFTEDRTDIEDWRSVDELKLRDFFFRVTCVLFGLFGRL